MISMCELDCELVPAALLKMLAPCSLERNRIVACKILGP